MEPSASCHRMAAAAPREPADRLHGTDRIVAFSGGRVAPARGPSYSRRRKSRGSFFVHKDIGVKHPLQCRCGTIKGFVFDPQRANRAVCYCRDCQAFAYFLEKADEILDERGGSEVIQVLPRNVSFTQGTEALACMRLTGKGLLRWYARCCNTPIGNTLDNFKISFIGLVHSCLETSGRPSKIPSALCACGSTQKAPGEIRNRRQWDSARRSYGSWPTSRKPVSTAATNRLPFFWWIKVHPSLLRGC